MSESKEKQFARRKRTFLPEKQQGGAEDLVINILSTTLEVLYEMFMCVARPVGSLVTYLCCECYKYWSSRRK